MIFLKQLNRFALNDDKLEIVLSEGERGNSIYYRIDINDNKEHETSYCYEFLSKPRAKDFFNSMVKHIFTV